MKFTIVRHGETLANQKMLLSGQHETPLSENGIKQAKAVMAVENPQYTI
jgi:broad specificity phosphatase PhoE